jgi:CRISPR-associated endonuclease/helicase Cas3
MNYFAHSRAHLSLFWAKIGAGAYEARHCLLWHLIDVAKVARHVYCDVLQPAVREHIHGTFCVESEVAGDLIAFWAGAHDIGKATPGFQCRDRSGEAERQLSAAGFNFPSFNTPPHGVVTTAVLGFEQASHVALSGTGTNMCRSMAIAVGGHHGLFAQQSELLNIVDNDDVLGGPAWKHARVELLGELGKVLGPSDTTTAIKADSREHWLFMFVAGLTSVTTASFRITRVTCTRICFPELNNVLQSC